jgi:hypothetical protein
MSQQRMRKRFPPWASEFVNRSKRVKRKLQTDLLDAAKCRIKLNYEYNKKDDELRFYIDIVDPSGYPIIESANVCKGTKLEYNDAVSKEDLETKVNAQKSMLAEAKADDATIDYAVAVHPNKQSNPANYTPGRAVEIIFSIHKDKSGIITSTVDHLLVGCWSCGGSHLINPISKQHLGTILLLAYTLICGRKINAAGSGKLIDATGGYYYKFGWLGDDEELTLKKPGTKGLEKMKNVLLGSIYRNGPGKYLKKGNDEDVEDLLKSIKGLDRWSMAVMRGGRKTKRRKKRICCVGIGCPEWKHCIHVLGDGAKYRPKRKSTLKRMKKCGKRYTSLGKKYKKCMKRERKKSQRRKKSRKRKKYRKRRTRKKYGGNKIIAPPANTTILEQILVTSGIPQDKIAQWPKTLDKLLKEMRNKETILIENNGKIKRLVKAVDIKVYNDETEGYSLYEVGHYNQNSNGEPGEETKSRNNEGVLEKMMGEESPTTAMKRGIKEELGDKYSKNIRYLKGHPTFDIDIADVKKSDSNSYPGLPAVYNWYRDAVFIPELTENTFYNNPKTFFTKELKDDGTFKRWIKWEWRRT